MQARKAIILAAGRGSRLGNLTQSSPKCLVELHGRPLIEWQIGALKRAGIDEIVVVTGYQQEQLLKYGTRAAHNPDWADSNMVHTLFCAEEDVDQPVLVSYSDIVYDPETAAALAEDTRDTAISYDLDWLTLWASRFEDPLSDAESFRIDETGKLLEIGGDATDVAQIEGQYIGLLRFTPATFTAIREITSDTDRRSLDMTSLLARLIAAGHPIYGVPVQGNWCEVDCESDLKVAEQMVRDDKLTFPA